MKKKSFTPLLEKDLLHVTSHCRGIWEDFCGGHLFITGGTGFFGIWLLETFLAANRNYQLNAQITVLSRDPEVFLQQATHLKESAINWIKGDVRNFVFPEIDPTHVIHAATTSSHSIEDDEMRRTIVDGTRRVLDFSVERGVKKLLFTSSGAVYGKIPYELDGVPESFSQKEEGSDPLSAYAEGKREAERLCFSYSQKHSIEIKIARCFAFVGPHLPLDAHFAIGNFIRDAMEGKAIQIKGNGLSRRSYLYAADLMIWLWIILAKGPTCQPLNVGSEEGLTIKELAKIVSEVINPEIEILIGDNNASVADRHYVPNCQKSKQEYQLRPKIDLRESIRRTVEWQTFQI